MSHPSQKFQPYFVGAFANSNATITGYTFGYDPAGNLVQTTSTDPGESVDNYTLDNSGELTGALLTSESYTYDANGNRTGDGYVTGPDNQMLSETKGDTHNRR